MLSVCWDPMCPGSPRSTAPTKVKGGWWRGARAAAQVGSSIGNGDLYHCAERPGRAATAADIAARSTGATATRQIDPANAGEDQRDCGRAPEQHPRRSVAGEPGHAGLWLAQSLMSRCVACFLGRRTCASMAPTPQHHGRHGHGVHHWQASWRSVMSHRSSPRRGRRGARRCNNAPAARVHAIYFGGTHK